MTADTASFTPSDPCPCGSGRSYDACCRALHQGLPTASPEALMRSRYSAYVLRLRLYLLATWHPSTRPSADALELGDADTRWLGLKVLRSEMSGTEEGTVEFVARYRVGGSSAVRMRETSRFVRDMGAWYYVDGVVTDEAPGRRKASRR